MEKCLVYMKGEKGCEETELLSEWWLKFTGALILINSGEKELKYNMIMLIKLDSNYIIVELLIYFNFIISFM